VDPLTLLAIANSAVVAVKKGCQLYKDIKNAAGDVSSILKDIDKQFAGKKVSKEQAVKIAEKAGVSPATVYRVHAVHKNGAPEVKELMSKGELSAKAADDFVRIVPSKEEQTKIVENGGVEAIKQTVSQKVEHALELLSEKPAWEEESTEEGKRNQAMFWNYNNWLVIRGMLDKLFCPNCGCTDLKLQCCGMSIEDAAKIAHDKTQAAIDETNAKRKVIADE